MHLSTQGSISIFVLLQTEEHHRGNKCRRLIESSAGSEKEEECAGQLEESLCRV